MATPEQVELIDQAEVRQILQASNATIFRERRKPDSDFPQPVKLYTESSRGRIRYVKSEVLAWFAKRMAERRVSLVKEAQP